MNTCDNVVTNLFKAEQRKKSIELRSNVDTSFELKRETGRMDKERERQEGWRKRERERKERAREMPLYNWLREESRRSKGREFESRWHILDGNVSHRFAAKYIF